jgi:hypothetical protein
MKVEEVIIIMLLFSQLAYWVGVFIGTKQK